VYIQDELNRLRQLVQKIAVSDSIEEHRRLISTYEKSNCDEQHSLEIANTLVSLPTSINCSAQGSLPVDEAPAFHGPSSTLHDEEEDPGEQHGDTANTELKNQLIANATFQRHREVSNFINQKFDFDDLDGNLAMHLLDLHWSRQHLTYLVTYRPAVMDSLVSSGPYANKLLLNAIYFSSSLYSDRIAKSRETMSPMSASFFMRFQSLLGKELEQSTIPTITALLLMGAALVSIGKATSGWLYCGIAYRMVIDLGCHLEVSSHSAIEAEIRRRTFWAAFVNDKIQSLYLGRPVSLQYQEQKISQEFLDTYEESEPWEPYIDRVTYPTFINSYKPHASNAVSNFQAMIRLSEIAEKLIQSVYSMGSAKQSPETMIASCDDIQAALRSWKRDLPKHLHLHYDAPPHQITLQ
jgi:hypothetical protein